MTVWETMTANLHWHVSFLLLPCPMSELEIFEPTTHSESLSQCMVLLHGEISSFHPLPPLQSQLSYGPFLIPGLFPLIDICLHMACFVVPTLLRSSYIDSSVLTVYLIIVESYWLVVEYNECSLDFYEIVYTIAMFSCMKTVGDQTGKTILLGDQT